MISATSGCDVHHSDETDQTAASRRRSRLHEHHVHSCLPAMRISWDSTHEGLSGERSQRSAGGKAKIQERHCALQEKGGWITARAAQRRGRGNRALARAPGYICAQQIFYNLRSAAPWPHPVPARPGPAEAEETRTARLRKASRCLGSRFRCTLMTKSVLGSGRIWNESSRSTRIDSDRLGSVACDGRCCPGWPCLGETAELLKRLL
jgi:hypothetical protein